MLNRIAKITKAPKTIKRFSQSRILDSAFCCWAVSSVADKIQDNSHFLDFQNIYVDVSIFSKHDNRAGIQRVVREVIFRLISDNDIKTRLKFVAATKGAFYRQVDYQLIGDEIKFQPLNTKTPQVSLGKGDVFIGLDFCPHIVPLHLFAFMRAKKEERDFFGCCMICYQYSTPIGLLAISDRHLSHGYEPSCCFQIRCCAFLRW